MVDDNEAASKNMTARIRGLLYSVVGLLIPTVLFIVIFVNAAGENKLKVSRKHRVRVNGVKFIAIDLEDLRTSLCEGPVM